MCFVPGIRHAKHVISAGSPTSTPRRRLIKRHHLLPRSNSPTVPKNPKSLKSREIQTTVNKGGGNLKMNGKIQQVSIFLIAAILAAASPVSSVADDKCSACNAVAVSIPYSVARADQRSLCWFLEKLFSGNYRS